MRKVIVPLVILLILCGCWDKTYIQDLDMVDVVGLDRDDKSNIKMSLAISSLDEAHQGGGKPDIQLYTTQSNSVTSALEKSDFKAPGLLTFNQNRLYILSKSFSSGSPTDELKILGRIATSPLNSSIVVYDGEVSEMLSTKRQSGRTIANLLVVTLKEAEKNKYLPKVTLLRFILCNDDPYVDIALPLITGVGESMQLNGAALFRDGKYSGIDLPPELTKISMLLNGEKGRGTYLISPSDGESYESWVKKASRKIVVNTNGNQVTDIRIPMKIQLLITDAGKASKKVALSETKIDEIEKVLTDSINKQALEAVQTLQKANCDFLGLAREIHAYHHDVWKQMNWREEYPKLTIRPEIEVQILNSGVML